MSYRSHNRDARDIFETIREHRRFKENLVIWMGLRASDYRLIDFLRPDVIASTRYGRDTIPLESKLSVVSTEKVTKIRSDSSMSELNPLLPALLRELARHPSDVYIVSYHSTPMLESIVRRFPNLHLMNPPSYLRQYLDQKTVVTQQLGMLGIRTIPGTEGAIRPGEFDRHARQYGLPLVVRFDRSAAGYGVHLVNEPEEFDELADTHRNMPASVMKYIDGKSMSISAVRTRDCTILSDISMQIIGQPECTPHKFGWCGNDFNIAQTISDEETAQIRHMALQVGSWIHRLGYRGIYGIDFMSDGNTVYFTEINPRFLGTSALMVDRQEEIGKLPISFFHIIPYLPNIYLDQDGVDQYNLWQKPLNVSQILLHNVGGRPLTLHHNLMPGKYLYENDELQYVGPAQNLSDTTRYDEIVITGEIPVDETIVPPISDELCKILTYEKVLDKTGKRLTPWAQALAKKVYSTLVNDEPHGVQCNSI